MFWRAPATVVVGARLAEKDWERLRKTGNDWVARLRDYETARPRDCGTTGLQDTLKNTVVLSCSQLFSVVRGV